MRDKISIVVLSTLIFVVIGAIACTYSTTNVVNPILLVVLGALIFVDTGAMACTYGASRIAKRKEARSLTK
jgi:hypothetical protein